LNFKIFHRKNISSYIYSYKCRSAAKTHHEVIHFTSNAGTLNTYSHCSPCVITDSALPNTSNLWSSSRPTSRRVSWPVNHSDNLRDEHLVCPSSITLRSLIADPYRC